MSLYISYCTFLLVLVIAHRFLISWFGENLRAVRATVWHCTNFVERRIIFRPNLLCGSSTLLRVAEIGSCSHFRMYFDAILSNVSQIHVFDISETVKCQEIFENK